jgi:hypothetical protein
MSKIKKEYKALYAKMYAELCAETSGKYTHKDFKKFVNHWAKLCRAL